MLILHKWDDGERLWMESLPTVGTTNDKNRETSAKCERNTPRWNKTEIETEREREHNAFRCRTIYLRQRGMDNTNEDGEV